MTLNYTVVVKIYNVFRIIFNLTLIKFKNGSRCATECFKVCVNVNCILAEVTGSPALCYCLLMARHLLVWPVLVIFVTRFWKGLDIIRMLCADWSHCQVNYCFSYTKLLFYLYLIIVMLFGHLQLYYFQSPTFSLFYKASLQ